MPWPVRRLPMERSSPPRMSHPAESRRGFQCPAISQMASAPVARVAALLRHWYGHVSSATITNGIKRNALRSVSRGNVIGTPNKLRFKRTL